MLQRHVLIGSLQTFGGSVLTDATCKEVFQRFMAQSSIPGVTVVDHQGLLKGLISRQRFMELFSQPYRAEVYFSRPLSSLLDESFREYLCFAASEPIDSAAQIALKRAGNRFQEPIAVRNQDGSLGVLEIQELLHALANLYAHQYRALEDAKDSLVRSEKLASLGALVAGVAHEINTPIGVSLSAASHLQVSVKTFDSQYQSQTLRKSDMQQLIANSHEALDIILKSMERAAALVKSFKQVSADQTSESRREFDLRQTVEETVRSLGPSFKSHAVVFELEIDEGIFIDSYPGALIQVLTNLILNAKIHAFAHRVDPRIRLQGRLVSLNEVALSVQDNGGGIAAEHLPNIFDPFFTTRRNQGGTGLGLHIVHNLIHQALGGSITVQSMPGVGTTFSIRMPRHL